MIKNLIKKMERKRMKKSLVNGQNSFTVSFLEYVHYCDNVSFEINDGRIVKVVDTLVVINSIKLSKNEKYAIDVIHSIDCSKIECGPKCPFYSKERLYLATQEKKSSVTFL